MNTKIRATGQSALETALVLPLLLLLFLLFIDLGRIVYYHSALSNAVREAARYTIVTQFTSSTQRDTVVKQTVAGYSIALPLNPADISVWCDRDPLKTTQNPCKDFVTVSATAKIQPATVFLAWMLGGGNTFNIKANSTMQMTPFGAYSD